MINRIAVCGLGKLGAPLAVSFSQAGLQVYGYDLDLRKVEDINAARPPVQEPGLGDAILFSKSRIHATTDPKEAVVDTQACIFVAPTPSLPDGSFDNQFLLSGIEKIAKALVGDNGKSWLTRTPPPYYFIIGSTVTPGTCDDILLPAIRGISDKINLVYKPELIALGTVMHDLANPDVTLFGARNTSDALAAFHLYKCLNPEGLYRKPHTMSFVEAELAKIALNCAITMKISFANQVGMVATKLGANPETVLSVVGRDSRIGPKALRHGMPFGGPCFPRDNRMFQYVAEQVGVVPHLAAATDRINRDVLQFILEQVPYDGNVGILGFGYKAGATIAEESAGLLLKLMLESRRRIVKVHDTIIPHDRLEDVLACETIIVATDCQEYRALQLTAKTVIDPMGITQKALARTA